MAGMILAPQATGKYTAGVSARPEVAMQREVGSPSPVG